MSLSLLSVLVLLFTIFIIIGTKYLSKNPAWKVIVMMASISCLASIIVPEQSFSYLNLIYLVFGFIVFVFLYKAYDFVSRVLLFSCIVLLAFSIYYKSVMGFPFYWVFCYCSTLFEFRDQSQKQINKKY